jgi:xanthine dehydrogenase accessory factor
VTDLWRRLAEVSAAGEAVALATVVGVDGSAPRASGARMLVWADGRSEGTVGGGAFEHRVIASAMAAIAERRSRRVTVHLTRDLGMCCGGAMDVFIEPVAAVERFVCFGAGHVAAALHPGMRAMGFDVTVVDEREEWNTEERFPGANRHVGDARAFARALGTDPRTWILLTTHEHALDQDLLEVLLGRSWAWLGLIGSRAKIARFFIRLRAAGVDEALFARVSAPVGLDLGAETPAEIAVAIAAEVVRARRGADRAPIPLGEIPLPARGGNGVARAPALIQRSRG